MSYSSRASLVRAALVLVLSVSSAAFADEVKITGGPYTLNGDLVIADGQEIADRIVLIVHGTLAHKDMDLIETLQTAFEEVGQNSLAINLSLSLDDRTGFYPCNILHTHKSSDALQEIDTWIDWLAEQGANDVVLFGHSRGGGQVAEYAVNGGRKVLAAVLLAPPVDRAFADDGALQGTKTGLADGVLKGIDFLHCDSADVTSSTYFSYYKNQDTLHLLRTMGVPTLVVSGSEDEMVTGLPAELEEIENSFVTHVEIPGAGHFFRDLYAYDVVDAVIAHMEKQEQPGLITQASSLYDDGKQSRATGQPIVVFVSQKDCEYCHLLRARVLVPTIRAGELEGVAILREVSLDPGTKLRDFGNAEVSGQDFATRYKVFVTPTLLFLDGEGEKLVDPLVGTSNIDLYEFYFKRAIANAAEALSSKEFELP